MTNPTPNSEACLMCNGKGKLKSSGNGRKNDWYTVECPSCHGTGKKPSVCPNSNCHAGHIYNDELSGGLPCQNPFHTGPAPQPVNIPSPEPRCVKGHPLLFTSDADGTTIGVCPQCHTENYRQSSTPAPQPEAHQQYTDSNHVSQSAGSDIPATQELETGLKALVSWYNPVKHHNCEVPDICRQGMYERVMGLVAAITNVPAQPTPPAQDGAQVEKILRLGLEPLFKKIGADDGKADQRLYDAITHAICLHFAPPAQPHMSHPQQQDVSPLSVETPESAQISKHDVGEDVSGAQAEGLHNEVCRIFSRNSLNPLGTLGAPGVAAALVEISDLLATAIREAYYRGLKDGEHE